jgi:hypothetical protein
MHVEERASFGHMVATRVPREADFVDDGRVAAECQKVKSGVQLPVPLCMQMMPLSNGPIPQPSRFDVCEDDAFKLMKSLHSVCSVTVQVQE